MGSQQFQGKTVEEATKIALEDLNVNLEEVKIEVVSPGKSGILGLGGEPAIINVNYDDQSKPKKVTKNKSKAKVAKKSEKSTAKELDDIDEETEKLAIDIVNYLLSSCLLIIKEIRNSNDLNVSPFLPIIKPESSPSISKYKVLVSKSSLSLKKVFTSTFRLDKR